MLTETYLMDTKIFADPGLFQQVLDSMPESRRQKILAQRFDRDRRLSLGAGFLIEYGRKRYGLDTGFSYGEWGKPDFPAGCGIHFNLSHSGEKAVCAFSDREVGADMEIFSRIPSSLIRKVCTAAEREYLSALDGVRREKEFFRLWTAKESYMKLKGTGLSLAPDRLELSFSGSLIIREDGRRQEVYLKEYPAEGYCVTVCSPKDTFSDRMIPAPGLSAVSKHS